MTGAQGVPGANGNSNNSGPNSYPPKPGAGRPQMPTNQPPMPGPNASGNMPMGGPGSRRPAPPTPGYANAAPPPRPGGAPMGGAGMQQHSPAPQMAPVPQMAPGGGPTLFLIYNGQRYAVTKDQFIIGRGSKTSDLPIKDGNISRKHAAVIRRNGTFYIKDLGSTNGIDYKGMRIDNKRIDEGDVFHLCDYELRFTYRAD
jgi:pSer/pThr/pTyr-binding forkhead associated (FHA) protein